MNSEIYYYSGTGNSLYIAKKIADAIDGNAIPIAINAEHEKISSQAEVIGLGFPVYYADLAVIVKEFAEKLRISTDTYLFAVCTYGGAICRSDHTLKSIFKKIQIILHDFYGVHMPQNAFSKPWENKEKLCRKVKVQCNLIIRDIQNMTFGKFIRPKLINSLLTPFSILAKSMTKRAFLKQSKRTDDVSIDELMRPADDGFDIKLDCTGCVVCASICPVHNIKLVEQRSI